MKQKRALQFGIGHLLMAMVLAAALITMVVAWLVLCWKFPAWNGWLTPDRILGVLLLVPIAACGAVTSAVTLLILDREAIES
jgi:hypothetical protein